MGGKLNTDFRVDSNGRCFLCLSRTQSQFLQIVKLEPGSPPVNPAYSLQGLSRYLKMDKRNVFPTKGAVPVSPHLLRKLEGSRLKVELCEDCVPLNKKASELSLGLEKIQMEMEACLTIIKTKLAMEEEVDDEFENQKIFTQLRKEATDKCFRKLNKLPPRVELQQLTKKEVDSWSAISKPNLTISSPSGSIISSDSRYDDDDPTECLSKVKAHFGTPKMDYESDHEANPDIHFLNASNEPDDDDLENDMELDDDPLQKKDMEMDIDTEDRKYSCHLCGFKFRRNYHLTRHRQAVHSEGPRFKCEHPGCDKSYSRVDKLIAHGRLKHAKADSCSQKPRSPLNRTDTQEPLSNVEEDYSFVRISGTSGPEQPRSSIISETGKIKCSLCPEDFRTDRTFQNHYQRFHLSVKCNLCGATYTRMDHYRRHHQKAHLGHGAPITTERKTCSICNRTFKGKHLARHQQSGSCRMRK